MVPGEWGEEAPLGPLSFGSIPLVGVECPWSKLPSVRLLLCAQGLA